MTGRRQRKWQGRPLQELLAEMHGRLRPFWDPSSWPGTPLAYDVALLDAHVIAKHASQQDFEGWLRLKANCMPPELSAADYARYREFLEKLRTPEGRERLIDLRLEECYDWGLVRALMSRSSRIRHLANLCEDLRPDPALLSIDIKAALLALATLQMLAGWFRALFAVSAQLSYALDGIEAAREGGAKRRRARLNGKELSVQERIALWREALAPQLGSDGKPRRGAVSRVAKELANAFGTSCDRERRFFYENADAILKP